ncbi:MAG: polysaccharide deacetylase family protein [Vagococcus sp.]|uniref:polysaccharide deacetylase family protein n=1 Tax=Vagococcus sp. TaxID=1933889 RepID=UPI002FCBD963
MKKHLKYLIGFLILEIVAVSATIWHTQATMLTTTKETTISKKNSENSNKNSRATNDTQSSQKTEVTEETQPSEEEHISTEVVNENSVALTFDDGPKRETTTQLLDILAQKNIKASFFILGQNIPGNEDLLKRMKEEGHIIGSHSMHHNNLSQMDLPSLKKDFQNMDDKVKSILKEPVKYIRPPYGAANKQVATVANRPLVEWSVDSKDWSSKNTQSIINQVTQTTEPGSIILMHDIYPETINAVPSIIDSLTARGLNFVTVDGLLDHPKEPLNYYGANDHRAVD